MSIAIRLSSGFNKSFDKNHLTIGSDASCDVVLAATNGVQPLHAQLRKIGDRWLLESAGEWPCDLSDSTKATKLWVLIGGSITVGSGDKIFISQATSSAPMQSPTSGTSEAPTASIQHHTSGTKPEAPSSSNRTSSLKDVSEDSHASAKSDNTTARRILNAKIPTSVFVAIPLLMLTGFGYVCYRDHQEGQKNVEKIREGTKLASRMHERMDAETKSLVKGGEGTHSPDHIPLRASINSASIDEMSPLARDFNKAVRDLSVSKTKGSVEISLRLDADVARQLHAVPELFSLLVRLFDENGRYLTHFSTPATFTAHQHIFDLYNTRHDNLVAGFAERGREPPAGMDTRPILLNETQKTLTFPVNIRDLRDAAVVEVGFSYGN